jgi:hypothetical protein
VLDEVVALDVGGSPLGAGEGLLRRPAAEPDQLVDGGLAGKGFKDARADVPARADYDYAH